jgi:hypothetical protein
LTGTINGTSIYEKNSGWLKNSTSNINGEGSMEAMGQTVPFTITSVINNTKKRLQ